MGRNVSGIKHHPRGSRSIAMREDGRIISASLTHLNPIFLSAVPVQLWNSDPDTLQGLTYKENVGSLFLPMNLSDAATAAETKQHRGKWKLLFPISGGPDRLWRCISAVFIMWSISYRPVYQCVHEHYSFSMNYEIYYSIHTVHVSL